MLGGHRAESGRADPDGRQCGIGNRILHFEKSAPWIVLAHDWQIVSHSKHNISWKLPKFSGSHAQSRWPNFRDSATNIKLNDKAEGRTARISDTFSNLFPPPG
jgi:hypothetical protein